MKMTYRFKIEFITDLEYWIRIALAKDENGRYINGPDQQEAIIEINKIKTQLYEKPNSS